MNKIILIVTLVAATSAQAGAFKNTAEGWSAEAEKVKAALAALKR